MICLSKADEQYNRHLSWNQTPSPLASTSTTRQDLNGISNLREHVEAGQDDGNGGILGGLSGSGNEKNQLLNHSSQPDDASLGDAGRLSRDAGMCWVSLYIPPPQSYKTSFASPSFISSTNSHFQDRPRVSRR